MRHNDYNNYVRQLYQELASVKIKIAFAELEAESIDYLIENSDYSVFAQKKAVAVIDKHIRTKDRVMFIKKTLPKATRLVAAILLVAFLGFTTAVATIQSVRIKVLEFIMKIEDEYTKIGFNEETALYVDMPSAWAGSYYITFIPDGYVVISTENDPASVLYTTADGKVLQFSEYDPSAYINLDTEDAETRFIPIHGTTALLIQKHGQVRLTWAEGNRYFIVRFDGDAETAAQIARSVIMIK